MKEEGFGQIFMDEQPQSALAAAPHTRTLDIYPTTGEYLPPTFVAAHDMRRGGTTPHCCNCTHILLYYAHVLSIIPRHIDARAAASHSCPCNHAVALLAHLLHLLPRREAD